MFNLCFDRRPIGGLHLLAVLAVMSLSVASCADSARAGAPDAGLGSKVAAPEATVEITASPVAVGPDEEWAAAEVIPDPLGSAASAEQIKAAAIEVLGPTRDVVGQLNLFVAVPRLPMPERADVIEFRADTRRTLDGKRAMVTAEVAFTADGTESQILDFYERQLDEQGASPAGRSERQQGGVVVNVRDYELAGTEGEAAHLTLEIRSAPALAGRSRSRIDLRHRAPAPVEDSATVDRLVAWVAGLPLPNDGTVTGVGIQTSSVGRDSLHYTLTMTVDGQDPPAIAADLRAALPAGGFTAIAKPPTDDETDNWVFLGSAFFDDARVSIHDGAAGGRARTLVNVDARVGLDR